MKIRPAVEHDRPALIRLISKFRMALAELRHKDAAEDLEAAGGELDEYLDKRYPIFVAENEDATLTGYLVCRVEGDVVWVESLFVEEACRRRGTGSKLYAEAERIARERGGNPPYNWVDPNNERIIQFLKKRGYNVLNLIELRKPRPGEAPDRKISVGAQAFDGY